MKVKLRGSGGYKGFEGVTFPVEVNARKYKECYIVHESELKRIGCDMGLLCDPSDPEWYFGSWEIEVVE